ncbi:MAG TPA: squalene/phytoene synthase family protein, partial [Steroidobacteraceae bacterium]|nr:squalene/phytoene synthase family protein [Steroidobacteraceae bacterium]
DGRLYVSLDELERAGLEHEQLRGAESPAALRSLLQAWHERIARELSIATTGLNKAERQSLRHAIVLARLHERLLARLSRRGYDVASARVELGPLERVWVAWRAARSTV